MDDNAFFHPENAEDLIVTCIDLALVYKCDPFTFLNMPSEQTNMLYKLTSKRLKEQAKD